MHITVNGRKIYYEIEGNGVPCIILNGLNPFHKRTLSTNIRSHLQLIFVDNGFCGYSELGKVEDMTLDSLINDFDSFVQKLNLKTFALLGHSAMVLLGLEYVRRFPDKVSHLILIGLGPKWWLIKDYTKKQQDYWDENASTERKAIYDSNFETLSNIKLNTGEDFVKYYVAIGSKFWYDPQFDSSPLFEDQRLNMEFWNIFAYEILKDYDATPFLSKISCPVFLAMGKYDFLNPPILWDGEKEKFPSCKYHLFEKSGHTPPYEEQALFDNMIIDWITKTI
ncbi:MAG: alpha/beta hydrolase [Candidatus Heimdallarchaeota archaeon]|nr:alpha/beta hydrolase [Candidatus Heimdallarchaeota archaeon]MCK4769272.1 alpha/beta hydrolase [Candidatus Heimdallarchaeota archaeon]